MILFFLSEIGISPPFRFPKWCFVVKSMSYIEKNETKSMPETFGWRKAAPCAPAYKLRRKDPAIDRAKWLWLRLSGGVAAAPHIDLSQSVVVFQ
ncbi:MAG: hypothetical protein ABL860_00670 [Candidatus Nitrotoga sp.]